MEQHYNFADIRVSTEHRSAACVACDGTACNLSSCIVEGGCVAGWLVRMNVTTKTKSHGWQLGEVTQMLCAGWPVHALNADFSVLSFVESIIVYALMILEIRLRSTTNGARLLYSSWHCIFRS